MRVVKNQQMTSCRPDLRRVAIADEFPREAESFGQCLTPYFLGMRRKFSFVPMDFLVRLKRMANQTRKNPFGA
jgi:hypothetical protein